MNSVLKSGFKLGHIWKIRVCVNPVLFYKTSFNSVLSRVTFGFTICFWFANLVLSLVYLTIILETSIFELLTKFEDSGKSKECIREGGGEWGRVTMFILHPNPIFYDVFFEKKSRK